MALKADTQALITFKDIGDNNFLQGEGIGTYVSVAYKRVVNDVTYTFKTTDTTYKRLRSLNGSTLSVSKPFGPITAKGLLELGPRKHLGAELNGKWNYEQGRSLELKALFSEKTGSTTFTMTAQPHSQLKVRSTINSRNQAVTSDAELKSKGFTLAPAVKWQTGEKGIALSHKFRTGTLKGSYAVDRQSAGLEYTQKPLKIILTSGLGGKKAFKPSLTLGYERLFDLSDLRLPGRLRGKKDKGDGSKVPEVQRDIPLDTKLRDLDRMYDPGLKEAYAQKEKHDKARQ